MADQDTIIIGGGHNGLICAIVLARAGQRVTVLEAGSNLGGMAAEREFHPGFRSALAQTLRYAALSDSRAGFDCAWVGFS